jgi:hypothetical protein
MFSLLYLCKQGTRKSYQLIEIPTRSGYLIDTFTVDWYQATSFIPLISHSKKHYLECEIL